jgi:UDP-glucose 4-epimerase
MKVVVTGAAGLIGSWVVEKLLERNHSVIAIDSFVGGYEDSIPRQITPYFIASNYKLLRLDLTDPKWASLSFESNVPFYWSDIEGADVMIHCACLAPEGYSVFSPSIITNSVLAASVNAMTIAIRAGIKRFINCSSMSRYGNSPAPFTEKTPTSPVDPYALAKVQAEQQINLLAKLHGMEVVHTVPHNVIGPRQRYNDPYRNVVSIMANLMLQDRQPIIYGDGKQTRCFSMIQDDVELYMKLLDYDLKEENEIFNIGPDDREISIIDLAELIAGILDFDLNPQFEPPRPHEVKRAVCSSDKIRDVFGYNPTVSLEDGIRSIVEYIQERGPKPFEYHIPLELSNRPDTPKTWKEKKF